LKTDSENQYPGKIAAHVKKIPVGKIKRLGHAINQGHAHRHQGIYGPDGQAGDDHVRDFIKQQNCVFAQIHQVSQILYFNKRNWLAQLPLLYRTYIGFRVRVINLGIANWGI
jgi:hypothetical protein